MVKWEDIFRSDAIILFVRNWRTLRSTDRFVKEIATRKRILSLSSLGDSGMIPYLQRTIAASVVEKSRSAG